VGVIDLRYDYLTRCMDYAPDGRSGWTRTSRGYVLVGWWLAQEAATTS
jgi:hypothetical protein